MQRIVSRSGNKTLIHVPGTERWVSKHFYDKGIIDPEKDRQIPKSSYQVHNLIHENKSELLNKKYRIWEIDKKRVVIFEDGTFYNEREIEIIKGKGEILIKKIHSVKSVFSGVVISDNPW